MILQTVADQKYHFIDIYTDWPSSIHDELVFTNSSIYKKGMEGLLFPNLMKKVYDKDLLIVLLDDSVYLLLQTVPD